MTKRTWKLTPEQKAEVIERYCRGEPLKVLVAAYGVNRRNIYALAKRHAKKHRKDFLKKKRKI